MRQRCEGGAAAKGQAHPWREENPGSRLNKKPKLHGGQEGPSLSEHGVVRWQRIDLSHLIETRFGIDLAERSVGDLLRRLGFRRLLPGDATPVMMLQPRRRIKTAPMPS